ncbi:MAG: hypothetical protein E6J87_16820 [Deltaproteobacteria bacterium]|nr:MAG: hypothetical protein E6J87_16820 [Deltaproteobacteria bacterium]
MKLRFEMWLSMMFLAWAPAVAAAPAPAAPPTSPASVTSTPTAPPPAPEDARTWFERGYLRRAAAACEQRLAAEPRDAAAGALLSRIRSEQGDWTMAMKLATAAAAADPKSADAQYALAEAYARQAQQASVLRQPGLAGKIRKAAEAALAIDPNHVDALEISSEFYRLAPGFMGGDKKKAAEYVERVARVAPVEGWLRRASFAVGDKDTVRAMECYRRAADVRPAEGGAQVAYATWLAQSWRDPAMAEKLALACVQAEPWRTGGWQVLAALYAHQRRWSDLDTILARSEQAEPAHLAPWYQAARQLIVDGEEPARAEGYLRHYLSREPEIGAQSVAAARWRLGQALEKQGKRAEALAEVDAAVKLDPKLGNAKKDLKRLRG